MDCEFCASPLPETDSENLALLQHVQENQACNQQFNYMLENIGSSWTRNMSGA